MSVSDGQIVLRATGAVATGGTEWLPALDASASVSRMGLRGFPPALQQLAPQVRFDLSQAADAARFGGAVATGGAGTGAVATALLEALLKQRAGGAASLAETCCALLYATCPEARRMSAQDASVRACFRLRCAMLMHVCWGRARIIAQSLKG
jgi:F0F1-type ATP synthase alpha subunit